MPVRIKNVCYSFVSILRDGDTSIFRGPEISSQVMIIHSKHRDERTSETKRNEIYRGGMITPPVNRSHHGHGMGADARRESRVDPRLPRDVARPDLLDDGAGYDVIDVPLVERGLRDEALVGKPLQIHGELVLVYCRGHGEG